MSETTLDAPVFGHFEVTRAKNAGNKPNPHGGELTKWYCGFKGEGHDFPDVYWQRKAGSEVTVGDTIYGKVEEGQHGLRFFKEPVPDGGGGSTSSGGSGASREWTPESDRDPERSARITRQHSQEMALRWAALSIQGGVTDPKQLTLAKIFQFADAFDRDVEQAGKAAIQGAGDARVAAGPAADPQGASPATTPAPESQPAEDGPSLDAHRLDESLNNAGVTNGDERRWLTNAWQGLNPESRGTALASLAMGDTEAVGVALKRLREIAGPMPDSFKEDPADRIPFRRPEYRPLFAERERWRF